MNAVTDGLVSGNRSIIDMQLVQPIVDAVLYEGYILYPYRPSSTKNQQRWTFGGIYPRVYHDATDGSEPWQMQTQCLVEGDGDARLQVRVRFLQPAARDVGAFEPPLEDWPENGEPASTPVTSLAVGDRQFYSWQEAIERDVTVADCCLQDLLQETVQRDFDFAVARELEPLRDEDGLIRGVLVRERAAITGQVSLRLETVADSVHRLTVRIENHTAMDPACVSTRDGASLYSFASTHTILGIEDARFLSLMDPPESLKEVAEACHNQGTYPVLVGRPDAQDTMLSSPIILHDYPAVAPESKGDLYDATEIDEILSLNILAMTDDEKREMAATDPRAAALLARTEALTGDDFLRMHGVLRDTVATPSSNNVANIPNPLEPAFTGPRLVYYRDGGTELKVGDRVCLRPKSGGDIMDVVLAGKAAVIESIERDFEDRIHVAVAIDDDPGREWGLQRMPGHRFFFSPEEIEPLSTSPSHEVQA